MAVVAVRALLAGVKSRRETEVVRRRVSGWEGAWTGLMKGEGMVARVGGVWVGFEQGGYGATWIVGGGLGSRVFLPMQRMRVWRAREQGW